MSKEQVYRAMCDDGYVGDDCSKCAESHGKADYNPLTCLKCPTSPWRSYSHGQNIPSVVDLSHQIMFFTAGTTCRVTRVTTSSPWFLVLVRWPLRTTGFMVWHAMGWLGYVVICYDHVFGFCTAWYGVNRKHFRAPENQGKWISFSFPSFSLYKALRAERCF